MAAPPSTTVTIDRETQKRNAGYRAVDVHVTRDGMIVGLGTGSTAKYAVEALAEKVKANGWHHIRCICTSEETQKLASKLNLSTEGLSDQIMDVAIDGCDEAVLPTLNLIKGAGAALLREKLVELSAREFVVISDDSKLVERLGTCFRVPVEIVQFGWVSTVQRIQHAFPHVECTRRKQKDHDDALITDEGNYIVDVDFRKTGIEDPVSLGAQLKGLAGVIEHGLFTGMASWLYMGMPDGSVQVHRNEKNASRL